MKKQWWALMSVAFLFVGLTTFAFSQEGQKGKMAEKGMVKEEMMEGEKGMMKDKKGMMKKKAEMKKEKGMMKEHSGMMDKMHEMKKEEEGTMK
jgi:hypothetical protein